MRTWSKLTMLENASILCTRAHRARRLVGITIWWTNYLIMWKHRLDLPIQDRSDLRKYKATGIRWLQICKQEMLQSNNAVNLQLSIVHVIFNSQIAMHPWLSRPSIMEIGLICKVEKLLPLTVELVLEANQLIVWGSYLQNWVKIPRKIKNKT